MGALPGVTPLCFYSTVVCQVLRARWWVSRGKSNRENFVLSAAKIAATIERLGGQVFVDGTEHLRNHAGAAVIIGNHMSTLEAFFLPGTILPFCEMAFVIKESILKYPIVGPLNSSIGSIAVSRTSPREDLRAVMEQGVEHLAAGTSVVIFPQTTRSASFNPDDCSTLGVKLARRAGVPVIPLALKTDIWANGSIIKDVGPVNPNADLHVHFGAPLSVEGNGREQHAAVIAFISQHLTEWRAKEGVQSGG